MSNVNEFTEAVLMIKDEIDDYRKKGKKGNGIPFMQERLTSRQSAANRFKELGPDQKREIIQRDGLESVMKMLQEGGNRNGSS